MAITTEETPAAHGAETTGVRAAPAISLEGVSKTYRSGPTTTTAVERVDLEIRQGEFFSLLGPSGCCKTSTMRMAAGLQAHICCYLRPGVRDRLRVQLVRRC